MLDLLELFSPLLEFVLEVFFTSKAGFMAFLVLLLIVMLWLVFC